MKRISDDTFLKFKPDLDDIFVIRVTNGELFCVAYSEDAENYNIKKHACNIAGYKLDTGGLMCDGDLQKAVECTDSYNCMEIINSDEPHKELLDMAVPYTKNGVTDGDHDIFILTRPEISALCDALRDGDYIIIFDREG